MSDTAIRASRVKMRSVKWLWEPFIPASMATLLAGLPGEGKSIFTGWLAARVTREGGNVIFANAEDDPALVSRPRLQAAKAKLDRVVFPAPFTLPDDLDYLSELIKRENAKLFVLDPLEAFLSHSPYAGAKTRRTFTAIGEVLAEHDCGLVVVHHLIKGMAKVSRLLDAVGGPASGLRGAVRAAHVFSMHPFDPNLRVIVPAKMNFASRDVQRTAIFQMESETLRTRGRIREVIQAGKLELSDLLTLDEFGEDQMISAWKSMGKKGGEPVARMKRDSAVAWLQRQLSDGPKTQKELEEAAAEAGLSWRTVRRASGELPIEKAVYGEHGKRGRAGSRWSLPA